MNRNLDDNDSRIVALKDGSADGQTQLVAAFLLTSLARRTERQAALIEQLTTALEHVQVLDVAGMPLYIGVTAASGCWSLESPDHARGIFGEWKAERDSALAAARTTEK